MPCGATSCSWPRSGCRRRSDAPCGGPSGGPRSGRSPAGRAGRGPARGHRPRAGRGRGWRSAGCTGRPAGRGHCASGGSEVGRRSRRADEGAGRGCPGRADAVGDPCGRQRAPLAATGAGQHDGCDLHSVRNRDPARARGCGLPPAPRQRLAPVTTPGPVARRGAGVDEGPASGTRHRWRSLRPQLRRRARNWRDPQGRRRPERPGSHLPPLPPCDRAGQLSRGKIHLRRPRL